jgi:hypothetical protein
MQYFSCLTGTARVVEDVSAANFSKCHSEITDHFHIFGTILTLGMTKSNSFNQNV